jgi:hypothetical protein
MTQSWHDTYLDDGTPMCAMSSSGKTFGPLLGTLMDRNYEVAGVDVGIEGGCEGGGKSQA